MHRTHDAHNAALTRLQDTKNTRLAPCLTLIRESVATASILNASEGQRRGENERAAGHLPETGIGRLTGRQLIRSGVVG